MEYVPLTNMPSIRCLCPDHRQEWHGLKIRIGKAFWLSKGILAPVFTAGNSMIGPISCYPTSSKISTIWGPWGKINDSQSRCHDGVLLWIGFGRSLHWFEDMGNLRKLSMAHGKLEDSRCTCPNSGSLRNCSMLWPIHVVNWLGTLKVAGLMAYERHVPHAKWARITRTESWATDSTSAASWPNSCS